MSFKEAVQEFYNSLRIDKLLGNVPDQKVLDDAITVTKKEHLSNIKCGDIVLVLRSDKVWKYGVFIHLLKDSYVHIEVGKGGMYKNVPWDHVRLLNKSTRL
jgi:hypothetical protein